MRRALPLLGLLATLAGCTLPPPEGDAPLRYRDAVFSSVDVQRDVPYGSAPDAQGNPVRLALDVYTPGGDTVARRPAIILAHGGGFSAGSRTNPNIVDLAERFARLGYVSASISYRLLAPPGCASQGTNPPPDCVTAAQAATDDAQAAVRYLRAQATSLRVDPSRIAMSGLSAGSVMALGVGTQPEDPGASGNPGFPSTIRAAVSICGGLPAAFEGLITPGDAPTLFEHGTRDSVFPIALVRSNAEAFRADGVFVVLDELQGAGHCPGSEFRDRIADQSKHFLYYLMDLGNAQR